MTGRMQQHKIRRRTGAGEISNRLEIVDSSDAYLDSSTLLSRQARPGYRIARLHIEG